VPDSTHDLAFFARRWRRPGLIDSCSSASASICEAAGYLPRGGQIIDATIVSVPKQRNTKERTRLSRPARHRRDCEKQPAKNAQKDTDARWTKKNDEIFYGYQNHVGVTAHKLIRKWDGD